MGLAFHRERHPTRTTHAQVGLFRKFLEGAQPDDNAIRLNKQYHLRRAEGANLNTLKRPKNTLKHSKTP